MNLPQRLTGLRLEIPAAPGAHNRNGVQAHYRFNISAASDNVADTTSHQDKQVGPVTRQGVTSFEI